MINPNSNSNPILHPIAHLICDIQDFQKSIYTKLTATCEAGAPGTALACVLPACILDIASEIPKTSLLFIDSLARAAIKMSSGLWNFKTTDLKMSVTLIDQAGMMLLSIPVKLVTSPIKVAIQVIDVIAQNRFQPYNSTGFFQRPALTRPSAY